MAFKYLYLVRHGQYDLDKESEQYGSLNKLGYYQAGCVAKRLQDYPIGKIHSSSLTRAKQTALSIIEKFSELEIKSHHILKEGLPYVPNSVIKQKKIDKAQIKMDRERMEQAFEVFFKKTLKSEDKHELLVCHGNIIRFFICKALRVPIEAWSNFELNHCSLSIVKIKPDGKMTVVCVGEVGHIPVLKQTIV